MEEIRSVVGQLCEARGWKTILNNRVVRVSSPFALALVAGVLTVYWQRAVGDGYKAHLRDDAHWSTLLREIRLKKGILKSEVVYQQVYNHVEQVCKNLTDLVAKPVEVATDVLAGVVGERGSLVDNLVESLRGDDLRREVREAIGRAGGPEALKMSVEHLDRSEIREYVDQVASVVEVIQGGNLSSATAAFVDYLRSAGACADVLAGPRGSCHLRRSRMDQLSGPWVMHPSFCVVSDRPALLKLDESGRLHSDEGPACRWRDGTRIYALKGVVLSDKLVDDPGSLTCERLEKLDPAQTKVCLDRAPDSEQVLYAIRNADDES